MSEVDVKAYLTAEDFRLHTDMLYWRRIWENTQFIHAWDRYQFALNRFNEFNKFRIAVLDCLAISE